MTRKPFGLFELGRLSAFVAFPIGVTLYMMSEYGFFQTMSKVRLSTFCRFVAFLSSRCSMTRCSRRFRVREAAPLARIVGLMRHGVGGVQYPFVRYPPEDPSVRAIIDGKKEERRKQELKDLKDRKDSYTATGKAAA